MHIRRLFAAPLIAMSIFGIMACDGADDPSGVPELHEPRDLSVTLQDGTFILDWEPVAGAEFYYLDYSYAKKEFATDGELIVHSSVDKRIEVEAPPVHVSFGDSAFVARGSRTGHVWMIDGMATNWIEVTAVANGRESERAGGNYFLFPSPILEVSYESFHPAGEEPYVTRLQVKASAGLVDCTPDSNPPGFCGGTDSVVVFWENPPLNTEAGRHSFTTRDETIELAPTRLYNFRAIGYSPLGSSGLSPEVTWSSPF